MQQLVFTGARSVDWIDAPEPTLTSERSAIVEPLVVSTCDMDAVALTGAIRFRAGTPLGHEGVGVVVAVGDEVEHRRVGDTVIVPWQISCGSCPRCRRGQDAYCESVPAGSCYGWGPHVERWGGFLAERFEVPFADHMLVPLPSGVDPVRASGLSDNLVDAWRSVVPPMTEAGGGRVLIAGSNGDDGGSIGVYAAAYALAHGGEQVVFLSRSAVLRRHAERYGAMAFDPDEIDLAELGAFDVTVDASGDAGLLAAAARSTGPHGVITCTAGAIHRGKPVPMPIYEMYMNSVSFRTGWVSTRPLMDAPLEEVAQAEFDPLDIAALASFDDAVAAFSQPFTKLVLARSRQG